jgi:phosphate transport system permease protein
MNNNNVRTSEVNGLDNNWHKKKFRLSDFLAEKIINLIAFVSFAIIILIFVFVFRETLPIFSPTENQISIIQAGEEQETYGEEFLSEEAQTRGVDERIQKIKSLESGGHSGEATIDNLLGKDWQPISAEPKYGILPLLVGSFKVTLVAVLIAAPIAILSALFTAVFAPKWAKETLKPAIEILAGFPSVVIGFFALIVLASVLQSIFGFEYRLNAIVGGTALSLAVIPIIFTVAEDAISSIPKSMTEASYALGAAKWQTALFVLLPAATPGVFAALLLGIGRAFGETMIVLMATGNAAILSADLAEPVRTLTATIGAEMAEVVFGDTHYNVLFLIGSLLFIITFTLNAIAEFYVRNKLMRRFRGK